MKNNFKFIFLTSKYGFTMVELIIVIAIVAILSTVAIPNFLSMRTSSTLRSAARELVGDIQKTKILAIKDNQTCAIQFNPGANPGTYQLISDWGGANSVKKTVSFQGYKSGVVYGRGGAGQEISGEDFSGASVADFVSYNSPDNALTFNPRGTSNSGYVYITDRTGMVYGVGTLSSGVVILRQWIGGQWEN